MSPPAAILGRRYDQGDVVSVAVEDGRVVEVRSVRLADLNLTASEIPWIAPGFVDLQVNGYGGQEFNDFDLTPEKVAEVSLAFDACGVTAYLPTSTTHSFEMLAATMKTLATARETIPEVAARVPGFHLEGPYFSPEDGPRGAHPREHCRPPDWDEFQRLQEAAGGGIRILTMSPEYEGSPEFISHVAGTGVVVAIGHTAANSDQIRAAVDAGACMSTHLGNGAHGTIRRHPNYIWDQLADDRLTASLIVDGHHLPASVVKCFVRGKTLDHCVLVSDIVGLGGMPPGLYENTSIGAVEILEGGRVVVAGQRQYLAGAALPIGVGVANVMQYAGLDLKAAVAMATTKPAAIIGTETGGFDKDAVADFVLFDLQEGEQRSLTVRATIKAGEVVHGTLVTN